MRFSLRILAVVGVFVLALCGCQKGSQRASSGSPDMAEAAKADSKSGHSKMKSEKTKTEKSEKSEKAKRAERAEKKEKKEKEKREAKASASHEAHKAAKESASHPVHKAGTLTSADDGMDFDFRQGQIITVVLDSNRASGLGWVMVEPAGSVIVRDGNPVYSARTGKNAGGSETWHFRAAKAGHQTVRMEYRRKWASSVPERTFRFTGNIG